MEDFKRPDHPDFMDSAELQKISFSGIRHNSITDYMELWIDGIRKREISSREYQLYPEKWAAIMEEEFALKHVVIEQRGN